MTLPSNASLLAWATLRGVDTGETEAVGYAGPYPNRARFLVDNLFPSTDGTRWFMESHWQVPGYIDPDTGERLLGISFPKRSIVILEHQAIWTIFDGATHVTNRWGDHVTITESGGTLGAPTTIVLRDEAVQTRTITLTIESINVLARWEDGVSIVDSTATLKVTNALGLPMATMPGRFRTKQRKTLWSPVTWAGMWDAGFLPTSLTESADGQSRVTTFTWPAIPVTIAPQRFSLTTGSLLPYDGIQALPVEVSFPDGLVEAYRYGSYWSLGAFSFTSGSWEGWVPFRSQFDGIFPTTPTIPGGKTIGVNRIITTIPGTPGRQVLIAKLWPKATPDAIGLDPSYSQPQHITSILTYPTANPTDESPFRGERLTHPNGGTSPGDQRQAYAFASALVLSRERIRGNDWVSDLSSGTWQPTVSSVDQVTLVDGYDLRSWANPTGVVGVSQNPVALRTRVYTPDLPTRTTYAGGDRDAYGPTRTDEVTETPSGSLPAPTPGTPVVWSEGVSTPSGAIQRAGTITRQKGTNGVLQTLTDQKTLSGSSLPSLRGVSSADFGITEPTYDDLGRVSATTGTRGGFVAAENRTYLSNLPLPTRITKTLTQNGAVVPANPAQPVEVGHEYEYDGSPSQWLYRERDLTDGRWTTYVRDSLGRETKRTDPMGIVISTAYDGWDRVSTLTRELKGAAGAVSTTYRYDVAGTWKEETVAADGRVLTTRQDLDGLGRVIKVTKPDGSVQRITYDGFGQKVRQTPFLKPGQSSYGDFTWSYDEQGRLVESRDRVGDPAAPAGRLLSKVTLQATWQAAQTLDGQSLPAAVWRTVMDDRGFTRSEAQDLLGQKAAVFDQKGQVSSYTYDKDGHLIRTQQGNQVRSYVYNDMGWLMSRTEPEEGQTTFSGHNMLGFPKFTTQVGRIGSGTWTTTTVLNNWLLPQSTSAVGRVGPVGPVDTVTRNLSYSASTHLLTDLSEAQNITNVGNQSLTESYGYDDLNRLNAKTVSDGSQAFTVSRTFDASGLVQTLTYPNAGGSANVATYGYDTLGRPTTVRMNGETKPRGSMLYDQVSGTSVSQTLTLGNNAWTTSKTDKGELVRTTHVAPAGVVEDNAVSWTAGGLMLSRGQDTFGYDALQRLNTAYVLNPQTGTFADQSFAYDRFGNRTISNTTAVAGTLANNSEALSWTASYTKGNDLPDTVNTSGGPLDTGVLYDDLGRMLKVWTTPGQLSTQTSWLYDPTGRVVKENGTSYLLDAEGLRFKRTKADGTVLYTVYGFNREPISQFTLTPIGIPQSQASTLNKAAFNRANSSAAKSPSALAKAASRAANIRADGNSVSAKTKVAPKLLPGGGKPSLTNPVTSITWPKGPISVAPGTVVSFAGASAGATSFSWAFGDGATATGTTSRHAYRAEGTYTVTFNATSSRHKVSTASMVVTVIAKPVIGSLVKE